MEDGGRKRRVGAGLLEHLVDVLGPPTAGGGDNGRRRGLDDRPDERDVVAVLEWVDEAEARGAGELFVNSIDRDGTEDGYDIPLIRAVVEATSTPVIASSGCGGPEHVHEVFEEAGADAALAASIFHFGEYTIEEVKQYLDERGVAVRR